MCHKYVATQMKKNVHWKKMKVMVYLIKVLKYSLEKKRYVVSIKSL